MDIGKVEFWETYSEEDGLDVQDTNRGDSTKSVKEDFYHSTIEVTKRNTDEDYRTPKQHHDQLGTPLTDTTTYNEITTKSARERDATSSVRSESLDGITKNAPPTLTGKQFIYTLSSLEETNKILVKHDIESFSCEVSNHQEAMRGKQTSTQPPSYKSLFELMILDGPPTYKATCPDSKYKVRI